MADFDYSSISYANFYKLEEDSVDVLFLGASHCREAFIPQELYNEYGITSYNLSGSLQSVPVSYYWLEEALQTQHPKVVVLDTLMFFDFGTPSELNIWEPYMRTALDNMRWGSVKWNAIREICSYDDDYTMISFLLPNVRYHERWKELDANDFLYAKRLNAPSLMGYVAYYGQTDEAYETIVDGSSSASETMMPLMQLYLDRMVSLCEEENIDLILVKTPTTTQTIERHNAVSEYAEQNGLAFYDCNEETLYNEIGYVFHEDSVDYGHANLYGAQKLTDWLGKVLQTEYGLEAHSSDAWDETKDIYEQVQADSALRMETDFEEYLEILCENSGRYTIFITVMDESLDGLSEDAEALLQSLGLSVNWKDDGLDSYCAVIEGGEVVLEAESGQGLSLSGTIRGRAVPYSLESAGDESGNNCSVMIDGIEYSVQSRGVNIVVYSNEQNMVIDSVCFDTHLENTVALR